MNWTIAIIVIGFLVILAIAVMIAMRSFREARETTDLFVPDDEIADLRAQWTETTTIEQRGAAAVEGPTHVQGHDVGDGSMQDGWLIRINDEDNRELADRLALDILMHYMDARGHHQPPTDPVTEPVD